MTMGKTMFGNILGQIYSDLDIIKQPFDNIMKTHHDLEKKC